MTDFDPLSLAEEAEAAPSEATPDTLKLLSALADKVDVLDARIEKGEALLKELKAERRKIVEKDMVDLMLEAKLDHFGGVSGVYTMKTHYKAAIPKKHLDAGIDWLEANEAGDLVVREVVATFTVEEGDDILLVTDGGKVMRTPADQVRITGRTAMGVRLARPDAEVDHHGPHRFEFCAGCGCEELLGLVDGHGLAGA